MDGPPLATATAVAYLGLSTRRRSRIDLRRVAITGRVIGSTVDTCSRRLALKAGAWAPLPDEFLPLNLLSCGGRSQSLDSSVFSRLSSQPVQVKAARSSTTGQVWTLLVRGQGFLAPGSDWRWPMDGFVYNGTFYLALMPLHAAGSVGAFGFAYPRSAIGKF